MLASTGGRDRRGFRAERFPPSPRNNSNNKRHCCGRRRHGTFVLIVSVLDIYVVDGIKHGKGVPQYNMVRPRSDITSNCRRKLHCCRCYYYYCYYCRRSVVVVVVAIVSGKRERERETPY